MNPSGCSISPQPPSGSSSPTSKARLASRYTVALNAPVEGSRLRPHQTNHGTLSSWPSPTTPAASQPALLKRLGELLRRHGEWVSALQKEGPNDIHQPHHTTIFERHCLAIDHLCSALGGSFAQYAPIFEGISELAKQMMSVYDLLATSALAVQDNNVAVDLQHSVEVAALHTKIEQQHDEINKLSDTAALLDRLELATLEERNLRQKLSDAELKVQKLTASISEQHEQYTSLHQRCVRANATEDRLKGVVTDLEERLSKSTVLAEALSLEQEYLREKVDGQVEELGEVRHQNGRLMKQLADFEEKLAASQEELSRAERRAQMRGRRESVSAMGTSTMARSRMEGTQREEATLPSPRRAAGRPPTPRPNWMELPSTLKRHSTIVNESNRLRYVQSPIDFLASCGAVHTLRVIKMSATGHSTPVATLTPEEEAVKSSEGKVGVLCKALSVSHQFVSDLLRTVDALVSYAESMRALYGELGVEPLETYKGMVDKQYESLKLELQATAVHAAVPTAAPVVRMPLPRPSIGNIPDMDRSTNSSSGDKTSKKPPLKGAPGSRSLPVPPPPPPAPFLCGHMLFHPRRGTSFGTIVIPSRLPPPPDVARAQTDRRYVKELSEGLWAPDPSDDVMLAVQKHLLRHTIDPAAVEAGGDGMYGFAVPMVLEVSTRKSTHKPHSKEHSGACDMKAFSQVTEHPALFFPLTLLVDLYEGVYDYIAAQHLLAGPDVPRKVVDDATAAQRLCEPDGEPSSSSFVEDFVCAVRHVLLPKLAGLEGLCSAQDKYLASIDNLVASRDAAKQDPLAKSTRSKKDSTTDAQWTHLGSLQTPPASMGTSRGAGVSKAVTLDSVVYSLLFHTYRIHHRLPAARLFLLHLHGCIAKTSFTLLRRCLGSVRRRMHDVAPTNLVVAVPPPEGGLYPKEAGKDGALPSLSDVVGVVGEEVPFLAPVWLPLIHESLLGDASTFALLVEGSHPFHYLLPSSSEYSHRSGEVMRLPTDTSVPASNLLTGDSSVSDIGFQVAAGCVRTIQGQHFDLVRLMMDGAVRVHKDGESERELLSLRTALHSPCSPFVQMLTHAFLTQQLWGVYSLQGALREVYTMAGGTLGAGLTSLLHPIDAFPEDATVSYMSVQQAFEKADPSARPDALRKLLADCAHLSQSDLAPRLKFSARGLAQRLLSVPYLRWTPLPPVTTKADESVSTEAVGVFTGASSSVALPTATTLPGLLKSFRAKQAVGDIGRDALRRRGMREAADEALIRFTSEPVHTM